MRLGILSAVILIHITNAEHRILNDYIRHYEELRYDSEQFHNDHLRAKRSTSKYLELKFSSLGRNFHLDLHPSDSVFSADHKSRQPDGSEEHVDTSFIYDGEVRGVPGSTVHGAVLRGIFQGTIMLSPEEIYFIEPADRYFRNSPQLLDFHSIIYREDHMNLDPYRHKRASTGHDGSCGLDKYRDWMLERSHTERHLHSDVQDHHRSSNMYSRDSNSKPHRIKRAPPGSSCYSKPERTCNLYLRADPVLFNDTRDRLGGNVAAAKDEILALFSTHVSAINQIYSKTKFETYWVTPPGTPCFEGMNFRIQRTTIMTDESLQCNTYLRTNALSFCNPNIDVSNFLNLNSLDNHDPFCLAFAFTYRDFSGGTLGLAWVGSPTAAAGGVCERYKTVREQGRSIQKSLNTGIVTLINYARRVPPRVSHLTFAHEVGHNFGSPHDSGTICAPGGDPGNFIMYPSATKGNRPNNDHFSKCSKGNITLVLDAVVNGRNGKYNCFKSSGAAFCGNGIVEKGEQCDCGYKDDCTDKCCHPRSSDPNDKQMCKYKDPSIKCSPTEGPCCTDKCDYKPANMTICRAATDCSEEQKCNGSSAKCPIPKNKEDMTYCNDYTQVCIKGVCEGSLCKRIGYNHSSHAHWNSTWDECYIGMSGSLSVEQKENLCYLSCKPDANDTCYVSEDQKGIPDIFSNLVQEVKNKRRDNSPISVASGTPCNNYQGYCDVFHRCRGVDNEGPLERLKNLIFGEETLTTIKDWIIEHWWGVMLIVVGVVIVMGVFIKVCSVNTPSEDPKLKKFRKKNKKERGPVKNPGPYYIGGYNKGREGGRGAVGNNRRNMELRKV
ncbi:disintegrin and metalloproteinase domain-containing protein 10-like [Saccostrea echinata]|uniref:disintegrin and metalloproteinase domain-containing protein 10-like n=1 Tax=Saccostrea echinata TaxID=191078 RepID=UPI002A7EC82F|nr:disintegrin and metalloproteinase domain-containing protein 10-like [Saccostrea echinata]